MSYYNSSSSSNMDRLFEMQQGAGVRPEHFVTLSQVRDMSDGEMQANPVTRFVLRRAWKMVRSVLDRDARQSPDATVPQHFVTEPTRRTSQPQAPAEWDFHAAHGHPSYRPPYPPEPFAVETPRHLILQTSTVLAEPRGACYGPCECGRRAQWNAHRPPRTVYVPSEVDPRTLANAHPLPANPVQPDTAMSRPAPDEFEPRRTWHVLSADAYPPPVQGNAYRPAFDLAQSDTAAAPRTSPETPEPTRTWHLPCETCPPPAQRSPYPMPQPDTGRLSVRQHHNLSAPEPRQTRHVPYDLRPTNSTVCRCSCAVNRA